MTLTQLSYAFLATALREVSEQGGAAFGSGRENMNEIRENSERTGLCRWPATMAEQDLFG